MSYTPDYQYNDAKHASLIAYLTIPNGHIDDAEQAYLLSLLGGNPTEEQINDLWMKRFDYLGIPNGHINDRMYDFLLSIGLPPQHINDMWYFFWKYLDPETAPEAEPYEFEMPDAQILEYEFEDLGPYILQLTALQQVP